jgi:hypothetical protein
VGGFCPSVTPHVVMKVNLTRRESNFGPGLALNRQVGVRVLESVMMSTLPLVGGSDYLGVARVHVR